MAFIQTIEFSTSRIDDLNAAQADWEAQTEGRRMAGKATICADRDRPGTYVVIVEFDSYESAMANSELPETQAFAATMAGMVDGPPIFRNLDVVGVR